MGVQPRVSFAYVDVDDAVFLRVEVIDIDLGSELDAPVDGAEGGVPVKQIEREGKILAHEILAEASEELAAVGALRAEAAGDRKAARVEERVAGESDVEKSLVADDRVVAFELVAIEWIVPVALDVRIFALLFVPAIVRKFGTPAICDHGEDFGVGWQRRQRARLAGCFRRGLRGAGS